MNQPARRRTDADATSANQSNVTYIFCGKLNVVQPATLPPPRNRQKAVDARGKPRTGMAELQRAASTRARLLKAQFRQAERRNYPQKRKTRPGGQPDGSSHMGALGVDGRSRRIQPRWGGITTPTDIVSRQGRSTFKRTSDFFNFLAGRFWRENYRAAGRSASPTADLSDAMAAGG